MKQTMSIAIAFAAGLLGGLVARYGHPEPAFAQVQPPSSTREIRAQSFVIVDPLDRTVGTFTFEPTVRPFEKNANPPPIPRRIVLRNAQGREIWSASDSMVRPLGEP